MVKTEMTLKLERKIWKATEGVFGCFEVTIGWSGKERVDYMTYDSKGIFRCYEIKVSKSDFYSKAKKSFVGHYNYYVMPEELYEQVKGDIPEGIGVYDGINCIKRARKQELIVDEQTLKDSLIRSLSREAAKKYNSDDPYLVETLNRRIAQARKERDRYQREYRELERRVAEKYGARWGEE